MALRYLISASVCKTEHTHFTGAAVAKNLPATQETQIQSLGGDDPLEEDGNLLQGQLAWQPPPWQPTSVLLPGEALGQKKPGGLQSIGYQSQT